MSTKRPFAIPFINRLDRYLLLNKPEIWSARAHLVIYYALFFFALLAVIAFIVPDDPRTRTPAPLWIGFVSLVSLVSIVGWIIYLLRFNVFKRFGLTSPLNRLITFLLYLLAMIIFILFCYVEPYVETVRANAAYTDEEIVNDINKVNLNIAKLEYDSLRHRWARDTVMVTDKKTETGNPSTEYEVEESSVYVEPVELDTTVIYPVRTRREIARESLQYSLASRDSVQKLNDSLYVFFDAPEYTLLYVYNGDIDTSKAKLFSSVDIYRQAIVNYTPPTNKQQLRNELTDIRKKYQWQRDYQYSYSTSAVFERIKNRYGIDYIRSSMYNILERKHRWSEDEIGLWIRFLFYPALILAMLLFSFRHSTAKTFFLTLLTAVILLILTSLVLAFAGFDDQGIFNSVIFYFIVSLGVSLTAFAMKKRSAMVGIAINLCLWLLPFVPLCIVASYYAMLRDRPGYYNLNYEQMYKNLFLSEIFGILLLFIAVGTYFHKVYRKWYAAPEN